MQMSIGNDTDGFCCLEESDEEASLSVIAPWNVVDIWE